MGQMWKVLQNQDFEHVIVCETQDVDSTVLRRILPGEVCQQRGPTTALASGVMRMPVEPEGWVTVHARLVQGPTLLEELDNPMATSDSEPTSFMNWAHQAGHPG